ncbi:hypothetical protein AB4Z50_24915 [Paenibacillus sp. 2TAB26]|uniref:hypothetical protein n=1 Tax=Paenibacillus sp. 2TAB26 TaxID=3233005 RepID=UPI003F95DFFF
MIKRNMIVPALFLIVIAGIVVFTTFSKQTTFKKAISDQLNVTQISSIEILKSTDDPLEEKIIVTDSALIERIMNVFSNTKLIKEHFSTNNYKESYWITIKTNENRQFGFTLYDHHFLNVFDYNASKNAANSYKITNELDASVIRDLFAKV